MRTETTFKQTQIVFFRRLPKGRATVTNHNDITDTIRREREETTGLVTGANVLNPCHGLESPHNLLGRNSCIKIDSGKRAESTVMHDVGIGNGENDPRLLSPEPGAEQLAQVNDLWLPQGVVFIVHAVVGGDAYDRTTGVKGTKILIKTLMKAVRFHRSRRVFMLNVVGQGEIHQGRLIALECAESSFQDKFTQLTRIDFRGIPPNQRIDIVDAVLRLLGFMRLFC